MHVHIGVTIVTLSVFFLFEVHHKMAYSLYLNTAHTLTLKISHMWNWQKHDDVIKWKHFPRYWPFVRGIHRWPVNSPHKGQWHGALMFCLICAWTNGWVNNGDAGDLRRHRAHFYVTVMHFRVLEDYTIFKYYQKILLNHISDSHASYPLAWFSYNFNMNK